MDIIKGAGSVLRPTSVQCGYPLGFLFGSHFRSHFGTHFGTHLGTHCGTHVGAHFGTQFGTHFGTHFRIQNPALLWNSLVDPFIDPTTDMVFTKDAGAGAKCDHVCVRT